MIVLSFGVCILLALGHVSGSDMMQRATDPVTRLRTTADHLSNQANNLQSKLTGLTDSLAARQNSLDSLVSQLQVDQQVLANMTRQLNQNNNQLTSLQKVCNSSSVNLLGRVGVLDQPVAFTVQFRNDTVGNLTTHIRTGNVLMFDQLRYYGEGPYYNTSTGRFTAPTKGTYAFFLTIQRNNPNTNQCLQVSLIRDNRYWFGCTASTCPPGYTSSSNTCITYLEKGHTVHAAADHADSVYGYLHTTFSGFRMTPN